MRQKIKILIVINDFLVGGAQKLILDQLKYIDRDQFEVVLVTLYEFFTRKDFYGKLPRDISLYRLNFRFLWNVKGWLRFFRVLKLEKPRIVVSHLFDSNFIARVLKVFLGYKAVIVEHNTYINKKRWQIFADYLLSFVTEIIVAVSVMVKNFTAAQEKIKPEKFKVICNGLDLDSIQNFKSVFSKIDLRKKFGFGDEQIFLSVGRLTDQKNHRLLIDGFSVSIEHGLKAKLLIAGEGYLEEKLKLMVEKLGMEKSIFILGSRQNIFDYYRSSDFLVSTSKIEGLSIAYLEALAFGLPIIATKTGGTDELIEEGKNGFFIESFSPASVSDSIKRAIQNNYSAISQYAYDSVQKYDIKHTIKKYQELYIEICSTKS